MPIGSIWAVMKSRVERGRPMAGRPQVSYSPNVTDSTTA
jgi:hypothetical protein